MPPASTNSYDNVSRRRERRGKIIFVPPATPPSRSPRRGPPAFLHWRARNPCRWSQWRSCTGRLPPPPLSETLPRLLSIATSPAPASSLHAVVPAAGRPCHRRVRSASARSSPTPALVPRLPPATALSSLHRAP